VLARLVALLSEHRHVADQLDDGLCLLSHCSALVLAILRVAEVGEGPHLVLIPAKLIDDALVPVLDEKLQHVQRLQEPAPLRALRLQPGPDLVHDGLAILVVV
jgi:hypothetical protein